MLTLGDLLRLASVQDRIRRSTACLHDLVSAEDGPEVTWPGPDAHPLQETPICSLTVIGRKNALPLFRRDARRVGLVASPVQLPYVLPSNNAVHGNEILLIMHPSKTSQVWSEPGP